MSKGFWEKLNKPFFILAPMADVTDWPFRQVIKECGRPDVWYTPFVSCDGLMSAGRDKLIKELYFTKDEHPIVAQFFGAKPENFYKCAQLAVEMSFDGIDINMGCPDRKVLKQGAGIALCKTPELAQEIITATKDGAGELPVSVKTRLGYHTIETEKWISKILETKIAALIVHGRTMKEASKVPAHWAEIGKAAQLAQSKGTLVIGNGDIMSRAEGVEKAKQFGLDGIMVGRGIFQNPWLFSGRGPSLDKKERLALLQKHTELFMQHWNPPTGGKNFDVLKRFYKVYVSGWDGAKELRVKLMATKTPEQVYAIINQSL